MNVLSLFDGISCGQLALQRAGIEYDNYFASEIDKYAIEVTQRAFPDTVQLGDVRNIDYGKLPQIDLLMGGSPCQGFSVAGKGLNFDDPRSALFFEFVKAMEILNPKFFLLENVPMKKEWGDIISEHMLCAPTEINSSSFSAQSRRRLYWTNIDIPKIVNHCPCPVESILDSDVDDKYFVSTDHAIKVLDSEVGRRKIAYIKTDSQGNRIYSIHGKSVTLSANGGGRGAKTGLYAMPCITPDKLKLRQNGRRFKPPSSKFNTLTAVDRHGVLVDSHIRKLVPVECERLQTIPDDYTGGLSDNRRYKLIGNAWTVNVISHILEGVKDAQNSLQ